MRYEYLVGLRYTRAGRAARLNANVVITIFGIAVGVWALIVVLSVINGFQKDVRQRILGVASHVQIIGAGNRLADWREVAAAAARHPRVLATAPFVNGPAMVFEGQTARGVAVRGIVPGEEERVADFSRYMRSGSLDALAPGAFGVVFGEDLALALGVRAGDKVTLVAPQGQAMSTGAMPRLQPFTVAGTFQVGFADVDAGLALVHLRDAQVLYGMGEAVSGVRLKLDDPFAARSVARQLLASLPLDTFASDWTRSHVNFFRAADIAKRMIATVLALIILVAAINMVSTLVVAVANKRGDIAILRTLGASPLSVMRIFVVQGMLIGTAGTLIGVALGIFTAVNVETVAPVVESAFNIKFLSKEVYLIPDLPSQVQAGDVTAIALAALALSFLATLYPSWRAARMNPAEALRYD